MKTVKSNFERYFGYLFILILALGLNSCSDDDDVTVDPEPDPTGSITVNDQTLTQNTITVESVTAGQTSWIVARNAGEENDPEIVSEPVMVEEGTTENVELSINEDANLTGTTEGDEIVIMLHADDPIDGTQGGFDYDNAQDADQIITGASETITVTAPSLYAEDEQMVTENNEVTFSSVNTAGDGWITLYGEDEEGNLDEDNLLGRRYVEAGEHTDYTVAFDDPDADYTGQTIHPRLHREDTPGAEATFDYTVDGTADLPETYGYDATGQGAFVRNSATTATPGGFTVGGTTAGEATAGQ